MIKMLKSSINLLCVIVMLFSNSAIAKKKEVITFTFSPGNRTFLQRITNIKEKTLNGQEKQTEETISITRITLTKMNDGWNLLAEPQHVQMKKNGKEFKHPLMDAILKAVVSYQIDKKGRITQVQGYEDLVKEVSKTLPPEMLEKLSSLFDAEALKNKEIAEWNGRIGDYVGMKAKLGDSFLTKQPFQLPNGSNITYETKTVFSKFEACAKAKCVLINQTYHADAENLAKMSGELLNNVTQSHKPEVKFSVPDKSDSSLEGSVERLIDPRTMIIYREKSVRTFNMKMDIPTRGMTPISVKESRLYEFEY